MRRAIVAALAAFLLAAAPMPSHAAPQIVAGPGAFLTTFATPAVVWTNGMPVAQFTNLDVQAHDVASDATRAPGSAPWCPAGGPRCPMFYAPLIGLGQTADIIGLEHTPPGVYTFACNPHSWMTGTLVVV